MPAAVFTLFPVRIKKKKKRNHTEQQKLRFSPL